MFLIIEIFLIVIFIISLVPSFFIFFKGILYFLFILFVHFVIDFILDSLVFFSVKIFDFDIVDDILDVFSFKAIVAGFNELRFVRIAFLSFHYVCVVQQRLFFTSMEISFCAFVNLRPYLRFIVVGMLRLGSLLGKGFRGVWYSVCNLCHIRFSSFYRLEVSNGNVVGVDIFG